MSQYSTSKSGLQVIGAGLPRTTTVSLQQALQLLGINPTYHAITSFVPNARTHGPQWLLAMQTRDRAARQKILAGIVEGYAAITDAPGCFFVEDWLEMFPDAKVILTLRKNPRTWLTSIHGSVGSIFGAPLLFYIAYLFVPPLYWGFTLNNAWDELIARRKFAVGGARTEEFYVRHNEHVRSVVARGRLLEFCPEDGDGWEVLCGFLGKEVPRDVVYPRRNERSAAKGLMRELVSRGVGRGLGIVACGCVVAWGFWSLLGGQGAGRSLRIFER